MTKSAASGTREYGRAGLFGVLVPQGNPVAEAEIRILLPPAAVVLGARLTSRHPGLAGRLAEYAARLPETLDSFAGLALDAVGVACTGAWYELEEQTRLTALALERGHPVICAARAVEDALDALEVRTLALVSPYPPWLTQACIAHWATRGRQVNASLQLSAPAAGSLDHGIYQIGSAAVLDALQSFDPAGAQALLLAGTGMPSLRAILARRGPLPVLSSNLCLAWALARVTGQARPGVESSLYGGWASRLQAAT